VNFLELGVVSPFSRGVNLTTKDRPQFVQQQRASEGFFRVLAVSPFMGRTFLPEEDRQGGQAVTVLSYSLWQKVFGGSKDILGTAVTLKGEPHLVVGVMPPGFRGSISVDLWTPLMPSASGEGGGTNYEIIARLPPDLSWERAQSRLDSLSNSVLQHRFSSQEDSWTLSLEPLQAAYTQQLRRPLLILWSSVALVLLVGCMNLAGLMLARSARRSGDVATRRALGAGRGFIVLQALSESLLLALIGGALGAILGALGIQVLKVAIGDIVRLPVDLRLDVRYCFASLLVSLIATALFSLLPALRISKTSPSLTHFGRIGPGTKSHQQWWLRRGLILGEVALGTTLLIGAGLLLRTLEEFENLEQGFTPAGVICATVSLEESRYYRTAAVDRLFERSLQAIQGIPEIKNAAVGLGLPYTRWLNLDFTRLGDLSEPGQSELTDLSYVTPGYFETLGILLRRGRLFTQADQLDSEPVVVVSESFVMRYFPGTKVVGSRLSVSGSERVVVGIVSDVPRIPGWGAKAPLSTQPAVFVPAAQLSDQFLRIVHRWFSPTWVLRLTSDSAVVARQVEAAIQSVDADLPVAHFKSLQELRNVALSRLRLVGALLGTLATLALILTAIGIYGLTAGSIEERRHELGIRLALGSSISRAVSTVTLTVSILILGGIIVGLALALLGVKLLETVIWGVSPVDPVTYLTVTVVLLCVGLASSLGPAFRTLRLNPSENLRKE